MKPAATQLLTKTHFRNLRFSVGGLTLFGGLILSIRELSGATGSYREQKNVKTASHSLSRAGHYDQL